MLPKRYFLLFFIFILLSFVFPRFLFAQTSYVDQNQDQFMKSLDDCRPEGGNKLSGECYSKFSLDNAVASLNCNIGGMCTTNPALKQGFLQNSLLGSTSNLIAVLYEKPPASLGIWLADTASNIGVVPKAYAQGIGFSALSPLLPLWKAMRNVSYALLIIVLLAIGLMIMFRTKIDPRTVISIQTALPRIVITLLLITFSYPIAGFMIDLMYVVLFLGISMIVPSIPGASVSSFQASFVSGAGGGWVFKLFGIIPEHLWGKELVGLGATSLAFIPLLFTPASWLAPIIGVAVGTITGSLTAGHLSISSSGLFLLLLIIVILFALLRIFFMLINAYVQILINIIFAPILLLSQAIPGQSSFSNWLKNLLSNLIVFPATAILICVAQAVSYAYSSSGISAWSPPMLGFGKGIGETIVGIGFALVIPQIVSSIKKAFGAKAAIPLGGAVGRVVGQPLGIGQQMMQTMGSFKLAFGPGGGGGGARPKT